MRQFSRFILFLAALVATALAIDYWNVTRKEKLLSSAVSQIGGRNGSIPFWPLGTEYRITLTAIPTDRQLDELKVANQMRGWVGIAFEDCELTENAADRLRESLRRCHLFVVQDGKMTSMVERGHDTDEPSDANATERPKNRFGDGESTAAAR